MKLFPIRGGIHPVYCKELSSEQGIETLPLPAMLFLPLQQHVGIPAEPLVAVGERVKKGQPIARRQGTISAQKHAPTSGYVRAVASVMAPHPSGLMQPTILLEPDGQEEWIERSDLPADPLSLDPCEIRERVAAAGVVGMGGAAFPSAVKLDLGTQKKLDVLLLNGAECEPYLTCDDRVMREHSAAVIEGARLMARALGTPQILIAIEQNKPQALASMTQVAASFSNVRVVAVPVQYPMGSERHLVQALTGRETPARTFTADLGVVVHNVATARAIQEAIRFGHPLVHRVVTVSGGAIRFPKNIETPIGALVSDLINFCGGFSVPPARLVNGGPMMGQPLPSLEVPVVKGMSGILALTADEVGEKPANPCIRCGTCVTVCPCGLVPLEMAAAIRHDHLDTAAKLGVMDCFSCGSCSWACPSNLPLVQYFNYAKGMIASQERERQKGERIRAVAEAHTYRLERIAAAKHSASAKKS